jgi:hypothetical protein
MSSLLFYVAPKESMEFILKEGILTPNEVNKRIKEKILPREVLGVSYDMDSSNFPEYVSLLENIAITDRVGEQICFAKTGSYNSPDFMAIGYEIDPIIRTCPEFVKNEQVKEMNPDSYPSEVLYQGNLSPELINMRFAVRANKY